MGGGGGDGGGGGGVVVVVGVVGHRGGRRGMRMAMHARGRGGSGRVCDVWCVWCAGAGGGLWQPAERTAAHTGRGARYPRREGVVPRLLIPRLVLPLLAERRAIVRLVPLPERPAQGPAVDAVISRMGWEQSSSQWPPPAIPPASRRRCAPKDLPNFVPPSPPLPSPALCGIRAQAAAQAARVGGKQVPTPSAPPNIHLSLISTRPRRPLGPPGALCQPADQASPRRHCARW